MTLVVVKRKVSRNKSLTNGNRRYDVSMSNINALAATLSHLQLSVDLECMCECECCGNGPIDWKLVRSLEAQIAMVETALERELAAEEEALEYEALELAA